MSKVVMRRIDYIFAHRISQRLNDANVNDSMLRAWVKDGKGEDTPLTPAEQVWMRIGLRKVVEAMTRLEVADDE